MEFSVIVPSWNAKAFLYECLKSIIADAGKHNCEIIVVDNHSSDGSPRIVRECFPGVKLICNSENLGFAKAVNRGIRKSSGEFIFIVNSDVIVKPGCFESMLNAVSDDPTIGLAGPQILDPSGLIQPSCKGFPSLRGILSCALCLDALFPGSKLFGARFMTYFSHDTARAVDMVSGCFWVTRKEALKIVGLLDEKFFFYGEDIDWCRRFRLSGFKVMFIPSAQSIHYGGASSDNAPVRFYKEMLKADLQYWEKYHCHTRNMYLLIMYFRLLARMLGHSFRYVAIQSKRSESKFKVKRSMAGLRWLLKQNFSDGTSVEMYER